VWAPTAARAELLTELSGIFREQRHDPRSALGTATIAVSQALGDAVAVDRLSADGRRMYPVAVHDGDPARRLVLEEVLEVRFPAHDGFTGRVLESGETLLIPRVSDTEIRALQPAIADVCALIGLRGFIVVPLPGRADWSGFLRQMRCRDQPCLTDDDAAFLEEVAGRFALVLENWELTERLRGR
jgi:hypothetical protein